MSDIEPFRWIQPHRSIIRDIRLMKDNLDDLEEQVRDAEWMELDGRGMFDPEQCDRLCEAVEGGMPYIQEAIQDLPDPRRGEGT